MCVVIYIVLKFELFFEVNDSLFLCVIQVSLFNLASDRESDVCAANDSVVMCR